MVELISIPIIKKNDCQDLLNLILDVIENNAEGIDYCAIIGVLDLAKDHVKEEMNNL